MTVDQSDNVLVSEIYAGRVYVLNAALEETQVLLGFDEPYQAVRDHQGHVYVTDAVKNVINVFTPAAVLTSTYPNSGKATGYVLNEPAGLALDPSSGLLYVADSGNNRIVVLQASDGALVDYVGQDGQGNSVPVAGLQLDSPFGVAVSNGLLVIADSENKRVVSLSTDLSDTASQKAYTGSDSSDPFGTVENVAVDAAGNIYVPDFTNTRVVVLPQDSSPPLVITGNLENPLGVAVNSSGYIFVGDEGAGLVVFNPYTAGAGQVFQTFLPLQPYDVAVDAARNVYVSVESAGRVAVFNDNGTELYSFNGLNSARGLALDGAGNMYVADGVNSVFVLNSITAATQRPGKQLCQASGFTRPSGVAVDSSNLIYVADTGGNRVVVLDTVHASSPCALKHSYTSGLSAPIDVAVDGTGRIYVLQSASSTIVVLSSAGLLAATLSSSTFVHPVTLALDASGLYVYVADKGANAVVVLEAATTVTALSSVSADSSSGGLATDSAGLLYVADPVQGVVVKYSAQFAQLGSFSTAAGVAFVKPSAVAVDGDDNVWVADTGNSRVVQLSPSGQVLDTFSQRLQQPFAITYDSHSQTIIVACKNGVFQLND